jgi:hypothetical protein
MIVMGARTHSDARTHSNAQIADQRGLRAMEQVIPGRLVGLQGRLARPFWGLMGIWASLCGALASNHLRWSGGDLLTLALVLLLADLAWGSLWDLLVGTDWRHLGAISQPLVGSASSAAQPAVTMGLPYTQPDSPGGRVFGGLNRFARWWRDIFWPAAGPAVLGSLVAAVLLIVVSLLLPERVRVLNAALVGLVGLGVVQRWQGRVPLAVQAMALVGLSWLAGHAAFADLSRPSLVLALSFALAAWGSLRAVEGLQGGLWLLDGGLVVVVALLAALQEPLAAGFVGLLLFGQIALQASLSKGESPVQSEDEGPGLNLGEGPMLSGPEAPALGHGSVPVTAMRRMFPWLLVAMLVAALAMP